MAPLRPDPLINYLQRLSALADISTILDWDEKTYLPPNAQQSRTYQLATLAKLYHDEATSNTLKELLERYEPSSPLEERLLVLAKRDYDLSKELPEGFSEEMSTSISEATAAWQMARKTNDSGVFIPHFAKLVNLTKQKAAYRGFQSHPYDALLHEFDENLTTQTLTDITTTLSTQLPALLNQVAKEGKFNEKLVDGPFRISLQKKFATDVIHSFGFDSLSGRQDSSIHPFTTTLGGHDVRITSHYKKTSLLGVFATFHEAGHALYQQNIASHLLGTPLGDFTSMSIHESQSRLWERLIGHSYDFWQYRFAELQHYFPEALNGYTLDTFYQTINAIEPGLIRVEADEISYNLHILVRIELEIALFDDSLDPRDIASAWNEKMKRYLGVEPKNDNEGFLQDIHWSLGNFGYFPTYMIGNLMSTQLLQSAKKDIAHFDTQIRNNDFSPLRQWLIQNIHQYGASKTGDEIINDSTGEPLTSKYYLAYLREKYLS